MYRNCNTKIQKPKCTTTWLNEKLLYVIDWRNTHDFGTSLISKLHFVRDYTLTALLHRDRQGKRSRAGQKHYIFIFQPHFDKKYLPKMNDIINLYSLYLLLKLLTLKRAKNKDKNNSYFLRTFILISILIWYVDRL